MAPDLRAALARWYGNPGRHYHTLDHVDEVLERFQQCRTSLVRPLEVEVAVLFHDAIYEVGRPDNEARSAALARAEAPRWFEVDLDRVSDLILLTAAHGRQGVVDHDAALFLDCDMAILGASSERYALYAQGVEREWAPVVSADDYRAGRAAFLRKVLDLERIFLSDPWHLRLDAQARTNLGQELSRLDAQS